MNNENTGDFRRTIRRRPLPYETQPVELAGDPEQSASPDLNKTLDVGETNFQPVAVPPTVLNLVKEPDQFGYLTTGALIFSKVVSTAIFDTPAQVLLLTGSTTASLLLWLLGGLIAWAGVNVYLEYGIQFPYNGGELYYINYVWTRPPLLLTYTYSTMFMLLCVNRGSILSTAAAICRACTREGTEWDDRVQKLVAVVVIGTTCLLQGYSRPIFIHLNNLFAMHKLLLLVFLSFCLFAVRAGGGKELDAQTAAENIRPDLGETTSSAYAWGWSMLLIQRSFLGYENANLIIEEVRRPVGDPNKVFRRAAKGAIILIIVLYMFVNTALYTALTKEEITNEMATPNKDIFALFFKKVFGSSTRARMASGTVIAITGMGNVMAFTFAVVRGTPQYILLPPTSFANLANYANQLFRAPRTVKQEIARIGAVPLPYPEFWAKTNYHGAPGPTLFLHFIISTLWIIFTPLDKANGFLVWSTLFTYARSYLAIFLAVPLLLAPRLSAFNNPVSNATWRPRAWSFMPLGPALWYTNILTIFWLIANGFVLVIYWIRSDPGKSLGEPDAAVLPSWLAPVVATSFYLLGAVYWVWDLKILPKLGYRLSIREERRGVVDYVYFHREITGLAAIFTNNLSAVLVKIKSGLSKMLTW
ncbi:uncharacterized protein MKZ38_007912 [Zalerion maritima]|uniref:Amino acid transporter n=1 Tax=Zalerion maritima TaxID=339359 RepID=A0AAD5WNY1_9PEZI|nr:uncharacterized protein MKZ38_007912 [Zalerion maritima]